MHCQIIAKERNFVFIIKKYTKTDAPKVITNSLFLRLTAGGRWVERGGTLKNEI